MRGSISAPSLDLLGPSYVNVRGLDDESGERRDLFRPTASFERMTSASAALGVLTLI
jgi:hypothetical protein